MSLPKKQTEHSVQFNNEFNVVLLQIYFTFLILNGKSYFDWKKVIFYYFSNLCVQIYMSMKSETPQGRRASPVKIISSWQVKLR